MYLAYTKMWGSANLTISPNKKEQSFIKFCEENLYFFTVKLYQLIEESDDLQIFLLVCVSVVRMAEETPDNSLDDPRLEDEEDVNHTLPVLNGE